MRTPARLVPFVAALALVSSVVAQVDQRAQALLDGLRPPAGEVVDTLDQVMVMTVHLGGEDQVVRSRTVIDYVNERAAIETELAPGMSATIVVSDGQLRMKMGGMSLPLPAGMGEQFTGLFDRDPDDMFADGSTASYDGVRSYGGLVEGEQVTITGSTMIPGVERADETRMLFAPDGGLIAVVVETDEGEFLTVFDEPVVGSAVVGRSATMYLLGAGEPERFATVRFEEVRINQPIAAGTFD